MYCHFPILGKTAICVCTLPFSSSAQSGGHHLGDRGNRGDSEGLQARKCPGLHLLPFGHSRGSYEVRGRASDSWNHGDTGRRQEGKSPDDHHPKNGGHRPELRRPAGGLLRSFRKGKAHQLGQGSQVPGRRNQQNLKKGDWEEAEGRVEADRFSRISR